MFKKIVLGLTLVVSLFASVESEVDAERFSHKNGVLTDSFAGMQWQDNKDAKTIQKNWQGAKDYCSKLTLGGKSDWRLPSKIELKYLYKFERNLLNTTSYYNYWTNVSLVSTFPNYWHGAIVFDYQNNGNSKKHNTRCVVGNEFDNIDIFNKNIEKNKFFFIRKKKIKYEKIYKKSQESNTLLSYSNFIKEFPNAPQFEKAQKNIYKLAYIPIKKQNNISGYEWFIKKYPKASQVKDAIKNIHKLAYNKAKEINTISSYNTFVYAYPFASQVRESNDKAYEIESKKYTDIGLISGFFQKEATMEKKARELLVRAKQIERISHDYSGNAKAGYIIVANRMYQLLQDKFIDSEATLNYMNSLDFKDFTTTFKKAMKDIKYILNKISNNTSDISRYAQESISISKQGFAESKADREMAKYKNEEHIKWEKYMKYREKGYN